MEFWRLFLADRFALLEDWLAFAEKNCKAMISRDLWIMVWDLATDVSPDLSDFEYDGAWPTLIDDFVRAWTASKPGDPARGACR